MTKELGNPRDLHAQAEAMREQDRLVDALPLLEQAIIGYQREGNYAGMADAFSSKVLVYKHLFYTTQDNVYITLAQSSAALSLEIIQQYHLTNLLHRGYFRLGEIAMLEARFSEAITNYEQALEKYQGSNTERGDYLYHLGEAIYKSGDTVRGKETLLQGLNEIQNNKDEVDPFLAHVWESGCYLRLTECTAGSEKDEAKQYLAAAEKIITSDPKLIIRKRQVIELKHRLNL